MRVLIIRAKVYDIVYIFFLNLQLIWCNEVSVCVLNNRMFSRDVLQMNLTIMRVFQIKYNWIISVEFFYLINDMLYCAFRSYPEQKMRIRLFAFVEYIIHNCWIIKKIYIISKTYIRLRSNFSAITIATLCSFYAKTSAENNDRRHLSEAIAPSNISKKFPRSFPTSIPI